MKKLCCPLLVLFMLSSCYQSTDDPLSVSGSVFSQSQRTVLSLEDATALFSSGTVTLQEGTYVLPVNFTLDLGTADLNLTGVPGKTIITSYDGTTATDFNPVPLDTRLPDANPDGIYVVTAHPVYSYGGGFAHIELTYNTGGAHVWYTQGTILKKINGIWSRHYTGAGFITKGNVSVTGVTFDNCQFYLFSPFGLTTSQKFEIKNSRFHNVGRVISSSLYGGINHEPNWYNALNYYPVDGTYRFTQFNIIDNGFEKIHTSIIWGFPPSEITKITGNTISDSSTAIGFFNLFMKDYLDVYFFNTRALQEISGNTFINIKQNNNWTTQLIRTSGVATLNNNHFIDTTPQIALFYGGDTSFTHNHIFKTNLPTEDQSPVIIIKSTKAQTTKAATNKFSLNTVTAPQSFFVALEGTTNNVISDNILNVKTVFSKNDQTQGDSQYVKISNNKVNSPSLTNVGSSVPSVTFDSIQVTGNYFTRLVYIHTGNTLISEYNLSDNFFIQPMYTGVSIPQALSFTASGNNTNVCSLNVSCVAAPAGCIPEPMIDTNGCTIACGSLCF